MAPVIDESCTFGNMLTFRGNPQPSKSIFFELVEARSKNDTSRVNELEETITKASNGRFTFEDGVMYASFDTELP